MTATIPTPVPTTVPPSERSVTSRARRLRIRRRVTLLAAQLAVAVVLLGGWQVAADRKWIDPFLWGKPSLVWASLRHLFTKGTAFGSVWDNLAVTLQEAVYGFAAGTVIGVVAGLALGSNRFLAGVLGPYIKILNAIPRIVLGSLFLVAFGLGIEPKIVLAGVLVFFVVFFNAFQGVREVNPDLVSNVRVLGASPLQVARHVTIPSALTWIIASLHTAFGFAIIGALVGEVLGSTKGMGLIISTAQGNFDPNTVWACMAILAVVTLVAEYLITLAERRVLRWRPPNRSDSSAFAL